MLNYLKIVSKKYATKNRDVLNYLYFGILYRISNVGIIKNIILFIFLIFIYKNIY